MGPMRAAFQFSQELNGSGLLARVSRVTVELFGSLALTGLGHATDRAILLGLSGEEPASIDPERIEGLVQTIRATHLLRLAGQREIAFDDTRDILWQRETMFPPAARTQHPNGMRFRAWDCTENLLQEEIVFSIGGGFLMKDGESAAQKTVAASTLPFPFTSARELLDTAKNAGIRVDALMLANECALSGLSADAVKRRIRHIWSAMQSCMERGMATEGILPGGLKVRRRAHRLAEKLAAAQSGSTPDPLAALDWLTVFAMAVNEENAAGGRVVTAPTNGAAGVVPAVAQYYLRFVPGADDAGLLRFFLTSAAIGILYKENASISGAEVGCQGEVGVACSMAAAGLVAAQNGTNGEVEHAAEIAMEHNLGMTCDPIGGLVQIPCIERNAMAAAKAVHAARIAMQEPEEHRVSLDQVIRTMYLTGLDMQSRYKETSLAGLALNNIEC